MGIVNKQYTFQDKDDADPQQVNTNFDDLYNEFNGNIDDENIDFTKATLIDTITDEIKSDLLDKIKVDVLKMNYPVGSVYINASDPTNPIDLLGFGDWEKFGQGRVPVGHDSTDTDFDTGEKTGGEKTHTLTENEMPSHNHTTNSAGDHNHNIDANGKHNHSGSTGTDGSHTHTYIDRYMTLSNPNDWVIRKDQGHTVHKTRTTDPAGSHNHSINTDGSHVHNCDGAGTHTHTINNTGGDNAHNNLQPYITVYMWKRVA